MKYKNLMARALYDNVPECAEELAFRKGDILTVIEQNTEGLEGWWLCSLHGRQGIVPGNRVKLLIGPVQETPSSQDTPNSGSGHQPFNQQKIYQVPSAHASPRDPVYQVPPSYLSQGIYQVPTGHSFQGQDVYQVPPSGQRSFGGMDGSPVSCKVVTPVRSGQGYVYEFPTKYQKDTYDIPPTRPLQGIYDVPPASLKGAAQAPQVADVKFQGVYDVPPAKGIYAIPPSAYRDDTDSQERLATDSAACLKHEKRPEGVYDVPPPMAKAAGNEFRQKCLSELAASSDPTPHPQGLYDVPVSHQTQLLGQQMAPQTDVYDTPRGIPFPGQQLGFGDSLSPEGKEGVYDVPPQVTQDTKRLQDATDRMNRLSFSSTGSTRSNMSTSSTTSKESSFSAPPSQDKRLMLDPDTAIERLYCHQSTVESTVSSLMAFVGPDWRSYEYMEKHINKVRAAVDKVEQSLVDYLHFAKGATANASFLSELSLYNKMRRELQRLDDSHQILTQTSHDLNNCNWSLNILALNKPQNKCDDLDRFVMVARTIPDDAKQLTTSISVNAEMLFKQGPYMKNVSEGIMPATDYVYDCPQALSLHPGDKSQDSCTSSPPLLSKDQHYQCNSSNGSEKSWMDDYDYVHLQGKEEFERQQKELLEKENIVKQHKMQLEHHQLHQFQWLEQEITKPVENDISKWKPPQGLYPVNSLIASQERQLLLFYSDQCETHFVSLLNAIDAFFSCISAAQPPRIFVAHSKFVILSAHKLVFIGDTLTRQLTTQEIRNSIMNSSNQLCELLKSIVMSTKMAALNYPSTASLQDMVDRVTDLSHYAQLFKRSLVQMASY
ncbi:Enhancer of filamentation 1 [Varanus komodoensis]|uniref:Breast cancer anti-estrogen resistance protein 1 n=1 Tax=Varanus komodoensis TaxID=61221 RepID=A0A8D2LZ94_VARKO|nr:enhancer of filamentation 1 [Varanus komodoensis]KAF7248807.1 Enhancer of filamentation 1 [Varanus komodoensis]